MRHAQPPADSARSQRMARGVQEGWDSCRNSTNLSATLLHLQHLQPAMHIVQSTMLQPRSQVMIPLLLLLAGPKFQSQEIQDQT